MNTPFQNYNTLVEFNFKEMKTVVFSDTKALPQVHKLAERLQKIAKKGYAFGHQDTTSYGVGWRNNTIDYRSDINDVVGDFPAVYGFDIGQIEHQHKNNLDDVPFDEMVVLIQKAHANGGIITISWHADNPVSAKNSWDTTVAVKHILKGGSHHNLYCLWLSRVAKFMKCLYDVNGDLIPIAFRPFHEMNGAWFWWGNPNVSPAEYQQLWQQTVGLLSKTFKVHNLCYVYAPNLVQNTTDYLLNYPGDAYVDCLGIDLYQHGTEDEFRLTLQTNLEILKTIATEKSKPFAITEIGLEKVTHAGWWTNVLDQIIANSGIAWVLLWRNHTKEHFYAPFPGQESATDFCSFKNQKHVLFLNDIKDI